MRILKKTGLFNPQLGSEVKVEPNFPCGPPSCKAMNITSCRADCHVTPKLDGNMLDKASIHKVTEEGDLNANLLLSDMLRLAAVLEELSLSCGNYVMRQGTSVKALFIVAKGALEVRRKVHHHIPSVQQLSTAVNGGEIERNFIKNESASPSLNENKTDQSKPSSLSSSHCTFVMPLTRAGYCGENAVLCGSSPTVAWGDVVCTQSSSLLVVQREYFPHLIEPGNRIAFRAIQVFDSTRPPDAQIVDLHMQKKWTHAH